MIPIRSCVVFFFVLLAVTSSAFADSRDELQQVQQMIVGKTVMLRNAQSGSALRFDAQGKPVGAVEPGGWFANSALRVERATLQGAILKIEAKRSLVFYNASGEPRIAQTGRKTLITLALDGPPSAARIRQALDRVFYSQGDQPLPPLPTWDTPFDSPYEKCAIEEKHRGYRRRGTTKCLPPIEIDDPIVVGTLPDGGKVYAQTKAVDEPELLSKFDLRTPRKSGSFKAVLVVDQRGQIASVQIVRSLGRAIDEEYLARMSAWKYDPARLNGTPVAYPSKVEMDVRVH